MPGPVDEATRDDRVLLPTLMVHTEQVMVLLILLAMARGRRELDGGRVTWMLLGGLVGVLLASAVLSVAMDRRRPQVHR